MIQRRGHWASLPNSACADGGGSSAHFSLERHARRGAKPNRQARPQSGAFASNERRTAGVSQPVRTPTSRLTPAIRLSRIFPEPDGLQFRLRRRAFLPRQGRFVHCNDLHGCTSWLGVRLMSRLVQSACPGCKKPLRIPSEWLSQMMRCKHCGMVMQDKRYAPSARIASMPQPTPGNRTPLPPTRKEQVTTAPLAKLVSPPGGITAAAPLAVPVAQPANSSPFVNLRAEEETSAQTTQRRRRGGGWKGPALFFAVFIIAGFVAYLNWERLAALVPADPEPVALGSRDKGAVTEPPAKKTDATPPSSPANTKKGKPPSNKRPVNKPPKKKETPRRDPPNHHRARIDPQRPAEKSNSAERRSVSAPRFAYQRPRLSVCQSHPERCPGSECQQPRQSHERSEPGFAHSPQSDCPSQRRCRCQKWATPRRKSLSSKP